MSLWLQVSRRQISPVAMKLQQGPVPTALSVGSIGSDPILALPILTTSSSLFSPFSSVLQWRDGWISSTMWVQLWGQKKIFGHIFCWFTSGHQYHNFILLKNICTCVYNTVYYISVRMGIHWLLHSTKNKSTISLVCYLRKNVPMQSGAIIILHMNLTW